jgi:hypothetical protein
MIASRGVSPVLKLRRIGSRQGNCSRLGAMFVSAAVALFVGATCLAPASARGASPGAGETNQWIEVDAFQTGAKAFCATVYMPATGEFLLWGLPHDRFEVETFTLKSGKWQDSEPADGLPAFPERGWRDSTSIHGQGLPNRVQFIASEGVERPSRAPTFHQVTYDTRRERVLFYVGGKTFSYDPKTRRWTDLKPERSPTACGSLVWASLCCDPVNDEAVLFGGGMALNLWGGAYTWLYDCEANTWRPLDQPRAEQPPLRCCVQTAFDAKNNVIVLFGGDDQSKRLADTWVYDVKTRRWAERKPPVSPPPVATCGLTYVASQGLVLMCSGNEQTWTYDAAANRWTRINGSLALDRREDNPSWSTGFMSCAYSAKDDAAVLVGMACYNPEHNVLMIDPGGDAVWIYRCKKRS